jgi:hypothetical protein
VKKAFILVVPVLFVFCMVGVVIALPFHDEAEETRWLSSSYPLPAANGWFQLGMPDWYNPFSVDSFEITMTGDEDNSLAQIDIFLDFDDDHTSGYTLGAAHDVEYNTPFTLTLDIKNNDLLYAEYNNTPSDVGDLVGVDLFDFVGIDSFWVGYGCHFTHLKTAVDMDTQPVPEPGSLLLLGCGLIGLTGLGRKIIKH